MRYFSRFLSFISNLTQHPTSRQNEETHRCRFPTSGQFLRLCPGFLRSLKPLTHRIFASVCGCCAPSEPRQCPRAFALLYMERACGWQVAWGWKKEKGRGWGFLCDVIGLVKVARARDRPAIDRRRSRGDYTGYWRSQERQGHAHDSHAHA